jgi:SAP domain
MPYEGLTVAQLKEECRRRSLPLGGLKSELIKRLNEAEAAAPAEEGAQAAPGGGSAPAVVAGKTSAEPAVAETAEEKQAVEEDPLAKRMKRFGDGVLTDADRVKRREDRFKTGDVIHDKDKLSARAERFGIITEEKKKEQELARAKRFNIDTPEIIEEKKKARMQRFSKPVASEPAPSISELDALIKKRSS